MKCDSPDMISRHTILPFLICGLILLLSACDSNEDLGQCDVEFAVEDLILGEGEEAMIGRSVRVQYDGFYCDAEAPELKGEMFESAPYQFVLGAGDVIEGWEEGVVGMREGGRRRITIPPEMAYGAEGLQYIPPNATLVFEVELLEVL